MNNSVSVDLILNEINVRKCLSVNISNISISLAIGFSIGLILFGILGFINEHRKGNYINYL
jgi:hypothetical protein